MRGKLTYQRHTVKCFIITGKPASARGMIRAIIMWEREFEKAEEKRGPAPNNPKESEA
jgi:hypothetical protein